MKIPSQCSQNDVPATGSYRSIEEKLPIMHLRQSGRDGDKVAYARNKPPGDGGQHAVGVEIILAFLYFFLIEHAETPELTVGKSVNKGAS